MIYNENEKVELKSICVDDIKKEMIAFLNTNGGTIYVGVNDDGILSEEFKKEDKDEISTKISNWISDAISPYSANLIKFDYNADGVLVINIKEGKNKPYYLSEKGPKPSGVYLRVGRSRKPASKDEILKMIMDSSNFIYEEEVSDEQDLTFKYFIDICKENNIEMSERKFKSLGIKNTDNQYTNLGLLLSDQSPIVVKFAKYDNNHNFLVKKQFAGSLLKILNTVIDYVKTYNDVSAVIDKSTFKRIETESYPSIALREVVLNAFAHADYFIRSNIKIEFFNDKVKITNPGGIYKATMDDIFAGVQTFRNPGLVRVLDKLSYIENFGTGLQKTKEAYENIPKKPFFYSSENFFIVELPNINKLNDAVNDAVNDFDLEILKIINANPGINTTNILKKMNMIFSNITINMVRNSIRRKLNHYIEYRGASKNGGYYII